MTTLTIILVVVPTVMLSLFGVVAYMDHINDENRYNITLLFYIIIILFPIIEFRMYREKSVSHSI